MTTYTTPPATASSTAGCTVELEDKGQDFLEFDIVSRRIVATRPCQGFCWDGREILNDTVSPGDYLHFAAGAMLVYKVIDVRTMGVES